MYASIHDDLGLFLRSIMQIFIPAVSGTISKGMTVAFNVYRNAN